MQLSGCCAPNGALYSIPRCSEAAHRRRCNRSSTGKKGHAMSRAHPTHAPTPTSCSRRSNRTPTHRSAANAEGTSRSSSATPRAWAKPTRCSRPRTPPRGAASTSSPAISNRMSARRPPASSRGSRAHARTSPSSTTASTLAEFDLDAAITRAPQLILVDELAHTNAPGCRHEKRYQDVEELLRAGIDVYTTVNVQHIESLNDMVASITGVVVRERIPDRVFDDADQVELVDIEPEDLLERLKAGLVYRPTQADRAQQQFLHHREPHRAARDRPAPLRRPHRPPHGRRARAGKPRLLHQRAHPGLHLPSPDQSPHRPRRRAHGEGISRRARRPVRREPAHPGHDEDERARLSSNIALAEQLGAHMETVYGDDVAFQIAEFARLSGISKIVMGRTGERAASVTAILGRKSLVEQLIAFAPNLDIYIIPDQATPPSRPTEQRSGTPRRSCPAAETSSARWALPSSPRRLARPSAHLGFADSSIISLYILTALLTAVTTTGRVCTIVSSVLSVVLYNFCFVTPLFSLDSYDRSYLVTFAIMFATAMVAGELTARITDNARASAENAYRTRVLLETNQLLQTGPWRRRAGARRHEPAHQALEARRGLLPRRARPSRRRALRDPLGTEDRSALTAHRLRARGRDVDLRQQQARRGEHTHPTRGPLPLPCGAHRRRGVRGHGHRAGRARARGFRVFDRLVHHRRMRPGTRER